MIDPNSWETKAIVEVAHIASELHLLPSEVMKNATTFDLMALDVYITYKKSQQNKSQNKPLDGNMFSQDQLQEVLNKHKQNKEKK